MGASTLPPKIELFSLPPEGRQIIPQICVDVTSLASLAKLRSALLPPVHYHPPGIQLLKYPDATVLGGKAKRLPP